MTPEIFLIVAICGFFIGVLSGIFGIGGGTMIIPVLNLPFGLALNIATATSLFVIVPTAVAGTIRYLRHEKPDIISALLIGVSGALASIASSLISTLIAPAVVLIAVVAVIMLSITLMIKNTFFRSQTSSMHDGRVADGRAAGRLATKMPDKFARYRSSKLIFVVARVLLGVFVGSVAGIVGVGGGFIIVPVAVAFFGLEFKNAAGLSLLCIAIVCIPAIVVHTVYAHIDFLFGLALLLGSVPGAMLGAQIVAKIPEKPVRLMFCMLQSIVCVMLVINNIV